MNKKTIIILITLFLFISLGVISFFVLNKKTISQEKKKQEAIIVNGIDISNWKTYRNEEYGYMIKYPSDWEMREFPNTKTGASFTKNWERIIIASRKSNFKKFYSSFDKYIYNAGYEISRTPYDSIKEFTTTSDVKGYLVNWNESVKDYGLNIDCDTAYFKDKSQKFDKDSKIISIYYNSEPTPYSAKIFNTMIKTFDYID